LSTAETDPVARWFFTELWFLVLFFWAIPRHTNKTWRDCKGASPARALDESASYNHTHKIGMVEMDISGSIGQPERCFIERPVNYLVEAELAFESKQILDDQFLSARLTGSHDSRSQWGRICCTDTAGLTSLQRKPGVEFSKSEGCVKRYEP
jgi:hypothetical protein